MDEMEEMLKKIFDLYFEEEYYTNKIHKDKDYLQACDEIKKLQTRLTDILHPIMDDDKIYQIIDDFEILYMLLSNVYRYHDFIQGLSLGITLVTISPKINNPLFVDKMIDIVNKTNR